MLFNRILAQSRIREKYVIESIKTQVKMFEVFSSDILKCPALRSLNLIMLSNRIYQNSIMFSISFIK